MKHVASVPAVTNAPRAQHIRVAYTMAVVTTGGNLNMIHAFLSCCDGGFCCRTHWAGSIKSASSTEHHRNPTCARQVMVRQIMIQKLIVETIKDIHSCADLEERCMCSSGACPSWCRLKPFSVGTPPYRSLVASCLTLDLRVNKAR